ncbi:MFS transporter [Actinokineospora globicatena]|uniref:Multidrug-efflux transporter n=1 Tax=Actinokineospora globicatena TaxID=103729 RepID=A0A9W6QIS2_9PSEU|nr:MFS transporter [Actinokineospora globicatena]GLW90450.1 putative multidrug-efflux transporter [Actinokineospora globicatena]
MRRRGPLLLLLVANTISALGTGMTLLAIPWFVLHVSGSAVQTGLVAAAETAGLVVASALAGPVVDRVGPRRTAVVADLVAAGAVSLIPVLHGLDLLRLWVIVVLALLLGLSRSPGDASRLTLVPLAAQRSGVALERATSAYEGSTRAARMLGGPVAGALIALWSPPPVLLIDAASFAVCAAIIGLTTIAAHKQATGDPSTSRFRRYVTDLREGLSYLRQDRLVSAFILMTMATNAIDASFATVILPVYADQVLHSTLQLGFLVSGFGLGALLGTIAFAWAGPRLPRWPTFTVCFLLTGAPRYLALVAEPPFLVLLAAIAVTGVTFGALNPIMSTVEYERIPEHLRGRVLSVGAAGAMLGMPVGTLLIGSLVNAAGLHTALVSVCVVYLVVTLSPLLFPVWRQMNRPPVTA